MPLIIAAGPGNAGDGPTWVGGVIPAAADTVDLLGFTVTVETGHTTNRWDGLVAAGGTLVVDGGLRYRGILTFDAGDTLDLRPTAELLPDCAVDNQGNVNPYINGGTILTSRMGLTAPRIHAFDDTRRPRYGLYLNENISGSIISGLEIDDWYTSGIYATGMSKFVAEDIWIHDGVETCLRIYYGPGFVGKNICLYAAQTGLYLYRSSARIDNLVCGEDLDGAANPNTIQDVWLRTAKFISNHAVLSSATQAILQDPGDRLLANDYGALVTDGIITGQGTSGDRREWQYEGTIERDGTDYTLTPNNNCSAIWPLRCNLLGPPSHCANIPVSAGDVVVPSLKAHAITAALECELWGSGLTLTTEASEVQDCELAETTFTWTGAVRPGGTDRQLLWEFRVREYIIGASLHLNSAYVSIGGLNWWGLDLDTWLWMRSPHPDEIGAGVDTSALTRAIYDHLTGDATLMACLTGGLHDTMAPPGPGGGAGFYPYGVLTTIDIPDESNFRNAAQMFYFQVDVYDGKDQTSAVRIGRCAKNVDRLLNGVSVTDLTGVYQPFWPERQALRRMKEEQNVWRISMDYLAFVTLV